MKSYNHAQVDESATINSRVGIGEGTVIHERTTIRGPAIIGRSCVIGPNTFIGLYTSIGDNSAILNTEIENNIIMNGAHIDCDLRITDNLIGKNVEIGDSAKNVPKGHKLIVGDQTTIILSKRSRARDGRAPPRGRLGKKRRFFGSK